MIAILLLAAVCALALAHPLEPEHVPAEHIIELVPYTSQEFLADGFHGVSTDEHYIDTPRGLRQKRDCTYKDWTVSCRF